LESNLVKIVIGQFVYFASQWTTWWEWRSSSPREQNDSV